MAYPLQIQHRRFAVRLARTLSQLSTFLATLLALVGPASGAADRIVLLDKFGYAA